MRRNITLAIALVAIIGATLYLESFRPNTVVNSGESMTVTNAANKPMEAALYPKANEIVDPTGFINTNNITIAELIGKKVILVDFWTYLCINCQHTIPYLKSWYAKYKDQGFLIIGVHTPELPPERDPDNVRAAVKNLGIEYPVVLDNNYATWNAYNNRYWPAMYLIDIYGYIVYTHFGEGAYTETEQTIQALLRERPSMIGTGLTTKRIPSDAFLTTSTINPLETIGIGTGNRILRLRNLGSFSTGAVTGELWNATGCLMTTVEHLINPALVHLYVRRDTL